MPRKTKQQSPNAEDVVMPVRQSLPSAPRDEGGKSAMDQGWSQTSVCRVVEASIYLNIFEAFPLQTFLLCGMCVGIELLLPCFSFMLL